MLIRGVLQQKYLGKNILNLSSNELNFSSGSGLVSALL